jgi:hypothetical protein
MVLSRLGNANRLGEMTHPVLLPYLFFRCRGVFPVYLAICLLTIDGHRRFSQLLHN